MAIPAGITTALVHLDAPISFAGDVGRIHATVAPSIPLVWAATGTPIGNFIDNVSLDPGVPLELELPHVDQPGFLDGFGNTVTGWYYSVEITYERGGQNIPFPTRDFQILVGQAEVDLALIPGGGASPDPQYAPVLQVISIGGLTGAVSKAQLGIDNVTNTSDTQKVASGPIAAALADRLSYWKANTAYLIGQVVVHPNGDIKVSKTNHTSASTTGTMNWADAPAFAAALVAQVRNLTRQRALTERANPRRTLAVPIPAAFGWSAGLPLFHDGAAYFTTYDVAARRNTGGTRRYVNTATGSNTNTGLTEAAAYLSLGQAMSAAVDGDEIVIVNKGVSYRNQSTPSPVEVTKSVNIVAKYPGETYLTTADALVYTAHATYPGVWQSARPNVLNVVDISVDAEGYKYPKAAAVADLATAAPGTWAHDGTNLFVRTLDGLAPDSTKVLALLDAGFINFTGTARASAQRVYLEGITFLGGQNGMKVLNTGAHRTVFTAKDCKFLWSGWTSADALPVLGNVDAWAQLCTAANSGKDGFNYHSQGGYIPTFVEIDCIGHSNGLYNTAGDYTMNASTAHDGVKGFRIGGKYHHTMGTPVADVNAGTQVIMASCDVWDSVAPLGSGYNAAIAAQQSGAELWLYGCRAWGAELSLYCVTGATIHVINTEYDTVNGAGTFDIVSAL